MKRYLIIFTDSDGVDYNLVKKHFWDEFQKRLKARPDNGVKENFFDTVDDLYTEEEWLKMQPDFLDPDPEEDVVTLWGYGAFREFVQKHDIEIVETSDPETAISS